MKRKSKLLYLTLLLLATGCCREIIEEPILPKTSSSYLNRNVDKNKYGNFELILDIGKNQFANNEPIRVTVELANTGSIPINFGNFDYYGTVATGLQVFIWSGEETCYEVIQQMENITTTENIGLEPFDTTMLIDFDLRQAGGFIHTFDTVCNCYTMEMVEEFGKVFTPAKYSIYTRFLPSQFIYESVTDTLRFDIN